ncbi:MAG: hypothetical protein LUI13_00225 [Lachnospiraceae bacterium]|nr:hypothetical protein [Lachnospiraceae bacterium]
MDENLFVIGLNMEDGSAEEIAWDAEQKILAIMDDLYKEQQEEENCSGEDGL